MNTDESYIQKDEFNVTRYWEDVKNSTPPECIHVRSIVGRLIYDMFDKAVGATFVSNQSTLETPTHIDL